MIEFNGQQFASRNDWVREFPIYGRHYWPLVRDGANTTLKLEQAIHARLLASRQGLRDGTRNSPINNSIKAKGTR